MANISDPHNIKFTASSEELADALEAYLKAIDKADVYYATLADPQRDGLEFTEGSRGGIMGRWTYASNIEGTFENPEHWFGFNRAADDEYSYPEISATWPAVLERLKAGDTIEISYGDDEPGCEYHVDAEATVRYDHEADEPGVVIDWDITDREVPERTDDDEEDMYDPSEV